MIGNLPITEAVITKQQLMPENWKTYKLKDLTTKIGSGATPRGGKEAYKESGISLIRSQNVLDFSFSIDGLAFIDDDQAEALNNVTLESQDVLLNITGDSVARVCKVPDHWLPARVNQHVAIVRADEKILNPDFLLYSLLSKENKNLLLTMAGGGATRNALTKTMIEEFEISIPEISEQKSIASILSALDNKIELNLQMNKTLEEMAMAFYKHWFVDFGPFQDGEFVDSELGEIPKGWEVKKLSEVTTELRRGISPKYTEEEGVNVINQRCIRNHLIDFSLTRKHNTDKKKVDGRLVKLGDVLVNSTGVGTLGRMAPVLELKENAVVDSHVTVVRASKDFFHPNIFARLMLHLEPIVEAMGIGSTGQTELSRVTLGELNIVVPPLQEQIPLENQLEIFSATIVNNLDNIQTLTRLRDTLLPKLISGEVRVKDVEKTLTEVL